MTPRDLKMMYLKDTGKSIYGIEYRDMANADDLFEYIHWLEERLIESNKLEKTFYNVLSNTDRALQLVRDITGAEEVLEKYKPKK